MTIDGQWVIGARTETGDAVADSVQAVCERRVDEVERALRASTEPRPG